MASFFMKMRLILFISCCFMFFSVSAEGSKEDVAKKIYTEEEFKQKLYDEVLVKIKKLKNVPNKSLILELVKKEEKIRTTNFVLTQRARELKSNEENFGKKVNEFRKQQSKILGCLNDIDKQKKQRIDNLVEIVSSMRPAAASQVLSVQGPEIAVEIIGKLSPVKSSKIFNLMDKEIAAKLQKMYMNMKR